MIISRISKTKQGRYALFDENGAFLFSVDSDTLLLNHLKEGTALSADALLHIQAQSDSRKAKEKAMGYLSLRDYASGELYDKLCQKFDAHTAAEAVAYLQELNLLDDANFASHRAKYLAAKNKSSREIRQILLQKGISRDMVEQALDALEPDDSAACFAIVEKHYARKLAQGETEKVLAALARRGFAYRVSKEAIERFFDEEDE